MLQLKDVNVVAAVAVIGCLGYVLTKLPDFNHEHEWQRQYTLEDRKYVEEGRKIALAELHTCYKDAEANNNINWSRACKSSFEQNMNSCLAASVPEKTCQSKIVFNADCELPTGKADRVNGSLDAAKAECRAMFSMEIK